MNRYNFKELINGIENLPESLLNYNSILYRILDTGTGKSYIGTAKYGMPGRLYDGLRGHVVLFKANNEFKCRGMYHNMNERLEDFYLILEEMDSPENYERILNLETEFIKKYDSVLFGYNVAIDGKPGWKSGSICVNDGVYDLYIYREDLERFLQNGFSLGSCKHSFLRGKVFVNNGSESKMIDPSKLNEYKERGYSEGNLNIPNKGKIWINDGKISKLVDRSLLGTKEYSNFKFIGRIEGPRKKRGKYNVPKKVLVNNGTKEIRIPKAEVEDFLNKNQSYKLGRLKRTQKP